MTDRIEEIFDQVINEDCPDPLRRFAELVRQDERQALAQEQTKCPRCGEVNPAEIHTCSPQVAQPEREWVGLTDKEMDYLWGITPPEHQDRFGLARAVEAKLKEKNA